MRNGNFIEFNVDNENDDESCSIISSANVQQQLMSTLTTTDYSLDHQSTRSPPSISNSSFLSPSRQQYSNSISTSTSTTNNNQPARNQRPASIVSDFSLQQQKQPYWWQQPSNLVSRITPPTMITNSSSALPSSSSPLLPKRNKVPANTTTTNSSHSTTSSGVQMGSGSTPNSLSGTSSLLNSQSGGSSSVTVHWSVGNCTEISITSSSTAFDLIGHFLTSQLYTKAALSSLSGQPSSPPLTSPANTRYLHCYALRMVRLNNAKDDQWLHPGTNVATFLEQQNREQSWKLELRIRYLPFSLQALAEEDPVSFKFLYDQVLQGFLLLEEEELLLKLGPKYQDLIVELGTLELRRSNPYLTPAGLEKSSNFEALEGELGRFLPAAFIASVKVSSFLSFKI